MAADDDDDVAAVVVGDLGSPEAGAAAGGLLQLWAEVSSLRSPGLW